MPETIKTTNVTHVMSEDRSKLVDNTDRILELPLDCWKGQEARIEKCREHFQKVFQSLPTFYVRVPGR